MRIFIMLVLLFLSLYSNEATVFAICENAQNQVVELNTGKKSNFDKDKMILILYYDDNKNFFVDRGDTKIIPSELAPLPTNSKNIIQFLEQIPDSSILYTLHINQKALTVQKSYNLMGKPIMVNTFLKCR